MNDDVARFLGTARWFGGKGRRFSVTGLRRAGLLPRLHDDLGVAIDLVEVTYDDGDVELYQLPLAFRRAPAEHLEHAHVGSWDDEDFGSAHVYDAVHDREAMACWLQAFDRAAGAAGADEEDGQDLRFHRLPGHDLDLTTHSTLFRGEQSNSSVAFGEDCLLKVFRKITPGENPDIAIHEVLTAAGSDHVAALYGWLDTVAPRGEGEPDDLLQLAMLQQFLRTASDGWELALASVRNLIAEADLHAHEVGGDFAGESGRLGIALAETHASLAEHFEVEELDRDRLGRLVAAMQDRLEQALTAVPDLAAYAPGLRALYAAVADLPGTGVQRIHGDLHLGQTLRTVRGWKLVDFEGEPARPLVERMRPDSVWRDVAGMLRSFDYAAAVVERGADGDPEGQEQRAYRAQEWAERNRTAFLAAYTETAGTEADRVLLDAYEADKAVYECLYEARNRPAWVSIPLAAVERIVA